MIQIEKGIAFPPAGATRRGRPAKYPFAAMEIGDSAFFPGAGTDAGRENSKPYRAANSYGRWSGKKFTSRKVTEDGVDGVRIWRVE